MTVSEKTLRRRLLRIAHLHPEHRKDLLALLKRKGATFPSESIGESVPGPKGLPGSDADKPWSKGQFTQQEFLGLRVKQERGQARAGTIRGNPKFEDLLKIMVLRDTLARKERKLTAQILRLQSRGMDERSYQRDLVQMQRSLEARNRIARIAFEEWLQYKEPPQYVDEDY